MNYSASVQSSEAQCVPIDDGTAEEENIDLKESLPSQIIQVIMISTSYFLKH